VTHRRYAPGMTLPLPPPRHYSAEQLAQVLRIERPHRALLQYYALGLVFYLLVFPVIPFVALYLYFRYHTMRYRFDAQGVMMRWGILFRREIVLAYARIQDIHLTSNLIERWLGLARIQISTASGSAAAEMTIEGLREFELVRDFLYTQMRGAGAAAPAAVGAVPLEGAPLAALCDALHQVSDDLRAVRVAVEAARAKTS
jgi:membrane protein YdbS with pleckstrin-like domain